MAYVGTPVSIVSTANSSSTPLGASGVFTGTSEDVSQYSSVTVAVIANVVSATDGLSIQQSTDGTNWDNVDAYTIPAATGKSFAVQVTGQFFRVLYTNGATTQGSFRLQTIYHYIATPSSSVRPQDARTNDNDMQETISYLAGYNGTTWDRLRTTGTGLLNVVLTAGSAVIGAVTGNVAAGSTASGNPVRTGVVGRTTNPTAVADGQVAALISDKLGKQVVVGSIRDLKANQVTTITSSTAETTIVTAVAAAFLDMFGIMVTNTSATAINVSIKDATAGTTRFVIAVPAGDTRGFMLNESAAHKQAVVNNNWTATCSASVASVVITTFVVANT